MKKYAKVVNETTKECIVGLGTDTSFYISQGMTYQDVDQDCYGNWFLKDYVPAPDKEFVIGELKQKLANTDYISAKIAEGSATREQYADIIAQRQEWRAEIERLEA
jgi:hypothetical protein